MIETESGDRQSQTRLLFCLTSVKILVVNFSSTLFLSPLQAWKENQKLRNFNIAPIHNSRLSDWLIDLHLRSVVVEWAHSGPWDAELKYFHVPLKMTSPDRLVWPWHHDEPALYILCKVNANSNKLLEKFEPYSSFRFQYRLLTTTTFFEIAV